MLLFKKVILLVCVSLAVNISYANSDDTARSEITFTSIEEALKSPDSVFRLDLSNIQLKKFPDAIFKFKNLEFLSLKDDHLKEIPKDISKLKNLKVLDLSGNDFSMLPPEIKSLKKLEEIYLGNNTNLDLDAGFTVLGKLPQLKILHLENDGLQALPQSINKLKYLEKLYLNENELTHLPPFIKNNKKLFYIDMKNNPLQWKGERPFGITINF
jgi:Leucine-rich repeat (LRR) protein